MIKNNMFSEGVNFFKLQLKIEDKFSKIWEMPLILHDIKNSEDLDFFFINEKCETLGMWDNENIEENDYDYDEELNIVVTDRKHKEIFLFYCEEPYATVYEIIRNNKEYFLKKEEEK